MQRCKIFGHLQYKDLRILLWYARWKYSHLAGSWALLSSCTPFLTKVQTFSRWSLNIKRERTTTVFIMKPCVEILVPYLLYSTSFLPNRRHEQLQVLLKTLSTRTHKYATMSPSWQGFGVLIALGSRVWILIISVHKIPTFQHPIGLVFIILKSKCGTIFTTAVADQITCPWSIYGTTQRIWQVALRCITWFDILNHPYSW
jgi:hypothetical protein